MDAFPARLLITEITSLLPQFKEISIGPNFFTLINPNRITISARLKFPGTFHNPGTKSIFVECACSNDEKWIEEVFREDDLKSLAEKIRDKLMK